MTQTWPATLPLPVSHHLRNIVRARRDSGLSLAVVRDAAAVASLLRTGHDPVGVRTGRAAALARDLCFRSTGLYPRPWLDAPAASFAGRFTAAVHDDEALDLLWRSLLVLLASLRCAPPERSASRAARARAIDALFGAPLGWEVAQLYPEGIPVERPAPLPHADALRLLHQWVSRIEAVRPAPPEHGDPHA